jgi:hypothetical protein
MDELREQAVLAMMNALGWTYQKSLYWENNLYNSKKYGWSSNEDYTKALYSFIENSVSAAKLSAHSTG